MLEKVARALARRRNQHDLSIDNDTGWKDYLMDALYAIEAMREPSDQMALGSGMEPLLAKQAYRAMIAAAITVAAD